MFHFSLSILVIVFFSFSSLKRMFIFIYIFFISIILHSIIYISNFLSYFLSVWNFLWCRTVDNESFYFCWSEKVYFAFIFEDYFFWIWNFRLTFFFWQVKDLYCIFGFCCFSRLVFNNSYLCFFLCNMFLSPLVALKISLFLVIRLWVSCVCLYVFGMYVYSVLSNLKTL